MSRRKTVIGQTGSRVLSDDSIKRKLDRKKTVRYQYAVMERKFIMIWICGPFHSQTYGACGFGTTRSRAKAALQRNLANNYRYFGHLLFSDVDSADNVGEVNERLLDGDTVQRLIRCEMAMR